MAPLPRHRNWSRQSYELPAELRPDNYAIPTPDHRHLMPSWCGIRSAERPDRRIP